MKGIMTAGLAATLAITGLAQDAQPVASQAGEGGRAMKTLGGAARTLNSAALLGGAQAGRALLYGSMPPAYQVLGLTDEQKASIEALCKEAQAENQSLYKATPFRRGMSREEYQKLAAERVEKQTEVQTRYEARIVELLTADQKALLDKVQALATEKTEADLAVAEKVRAEYAGILASYRQKLYAILPPEQAKKIEEADEAAEAAVEAVPALGGAR